MEWPGEEAPVRRRHESAPPTYLDEPDSLGPDLGAAGSGLILATLTMVIPFWPGAAGMFLVSALQKSAAGLVTYCAGVLVWQAWLSGLGPQPFTAMETGWGMGMAEGLRGPLFLAGGFAVALCYLAGMGIRDAGSHERLNTVTAVGSLACVVLFVVTMFLVTPAPRSFQFTLPDGWTVASQPDYFCRDFQAQPASAGKTGPRLCLVVAPSFADGDPDGDGVVRPLAAGADCLSRYQRASLSWSPSEKAPEPIIPGAYQELRRDAQGDSMYSFGLFRSRWAGPSYQTICYVGSLYVPKDSMTEAEVSALLASFRLR